MDAMTLLEEARAAGLKVSTDGDFLAVEGPKHLEPLALQLLAHKPAIMALLAGPFCWICGSAAVAETDGHFHCDRHALTSPTVRALWQACELYQQLSDRWDRELSEHGRASDQTRMEYFDASAVVHKLCQEVRQADS